MLMNGKHPSSGWANAWMILLLALAGCAQQPVTGGTGGLLTADGNPLPDVQLTVYTSSGERLGFAVTNREGAFELVQPGAAGALRLDPGTYIVTLESVGAPADLPQEYLDPESSPLRFELNEGGQLYLNVPDLRLR